jgi:lipoate-protein ligase A
MATDEAIVMAVGEGIAPPTLRFFAWQPPCLSLGYGQDAHEADLERCRANGWDIVRRPTGGRAILHIDELTYSVVVPDSDTRVAGGIMESYQRLSGALVAGLHRLGLMPERAKPIYQDHGAMGPACFDGPSGYEITVGGRKLIGSAQMRRQGLVLQHGALPLEGDIARIAQALHFDGLGEQFALESRLRFRATTLHLALGRRVTFEEAADALAAGFAEALNLTLTPGELTPHERDLTARLRREKYADATWTFRPSPVSDREK